MSKHSVTILGQRVVKPAGLETGQIVNNFHCFVIIKCMYVFVSENHMLDWQWCQICYPLEIKLLLTDLGGGDK